MHEQAREILVSEIYPSIFSEGFQTKGIDEREQVVFIETNAPNHNAFGYSLVERHYGTALNNRLEQPLRAIGEVEEDTDLLTITFLYQQGETIKIAEAFVIDAGLARMYGCESIRDCKDAGIIIYEWMG